MKTFPPGFLWGTSTSAYQIEGAAHEDGRGESIWDRFCAHRGNVEDGSSGTTACDHYHRFREDVSLMRELGMRAYRFSVAWPRILPRGRGLQNPAGIGFYDRLVDSLLEAGIVPFATLYHWDLPQALQDDGGWSNRATARAFGDFAETVVRRLGDRVKSWITHNEPWCASFLSHQVGRHAPGWKDWPGAIRASHHLLLSHGWAVQRIREIQADADVGIALNLIPAEPMSSSPSDIAAARRFDGYVNRWFLDPLHARGYPADVVDFYRSKGRLPHDWDTLVADGDLDAISQPLDFLGVNYYTRALVSASDEAQSDPSCPASAERTEMGWEIYPAGLTDVLTRVCHDYTPRRIYVTENGASFRDTPGSDPVIADPRRIDYLRRHFLAAHRAISAGVPVQGFFVWSLLDNFEWERGYTQRFGLVWVDYATQQRRTKASADWYKAVVAANALPAA
jgi:beta-glucosidase